MRPTHTAPQQLTCTEWQRIGYFGHCTIDTTPAHQLLRQNDAYSQERIHASVPEYAKTAMDDLLQIELTVGLPHTPRDSHCGLIVRHGWYRWCRRGYRQIAGRNVSSLVM